MRCLRQYVILVLPMYEWNENVIITCTELDRMELQEPDAPKPQLCPPMLPLLNAES